MMLLWNHLIESFDQPSGPKAVPIDNVDPQTSTHTSPD
jgi:hypothetical protein